MDDQRLERPGWSGIHRRALGAACAAALALCGLGVIAPAAGADPVVAAVGDVACAPGDHSSPCQQLATANLTSTQAPSAVLMLGDSQYESALLSEYYGAGAYNATWGRFNPIVHPVPGNHEYAASWTAQDYFTYFGPAAAGGYYSWDLGSWHLIALNSDCNDSGCEDSMSGTTSNAEVSWLQGDLASHQGQCILAFWHHPLFSSGWVGNSPGVAPFWNALYAAHADVVLNGHDHLYERFAQQDPLQQTTAEGIREFVVGTGGESLFSMGTFQPNMEFADNGDFGVLFLTLHPYSYEWAFRATDGVVVDSGSASCHAQPPPALPPPAPPPPGPPPPPPAPASLVFKAKLQPFTTRFARRHGLPLRLYCSRACDVRISLRVRRRGHLATLASYRRTETEIAKAHSTITLPLPRKLSIGVLRSAAARARLELVALDASGERHRVTLLIARAVR